MICKVDFKLKKVDMSCSNRSEVKDNIHRTLEIMKYHVQIILGMIKDLSSKKLNLKSDNSVEEFEILHDIILEIRTNEEYICQIIDKNLKKVFNYYLNHRDINNVHNLQELIIEKITDVSDMCVSCNSLICSPLEKLYNWKKKIIRKSKI